MFQYDFNALNKLFSRILQNNLPQESYAWLQENIASANSLNKFNVAFVSIPRKTGRGKIKLDNDLLTSIQNARPGIVIHNWSVDRLARVWLLMNVDPADKQQYFKIIENLFRGAEVQELVALYSSLPVLAYPEMWTARCAEGIRNNISDVLYSIMCNNPFPSENLNEAAWNQLVLKAFFTDKPIEEIIGLDLRSNQNLASTLSDYAHERWAAHRPVNPQLWRCVGRFINESIFPDIQKIASSHNELEQEAAALAGYDSSYTPAKKLIPDHLKKAIDNHELTWSVLSKKIKDHVLQ
jgi:hypothetical protein